MAILFGVLAIITAFFLPFLFGWVGFVIPMVFAALAIVFNILKNKKNAEQELPKTKAGLVCGIVGAVLAILMILGLQAATGKIKSEMEKYGVSHFPILEKTVDKLGSGGLVGMIITAKDEAAKGIDELKKEFENLQEYMKGNTPADETPASEASSEAAGGENATAAEGGAEEGGVEEGGAEEGGAEEGGEEPQGDLEGGDAQE